MKIKEAIDILESFRYIQIKLLKESTGYVSQIRQENLEAFTLAIEALERLRKIEEE